MSFPRYPEYKDSGVEWLGEVPAHWETVRLKTVSTCNDEVLPESTEPDYEIGYVEISDVSAGLGIVSSSLMPFAAAPSRARRIVRHGDVIVSTVRTYLKAIASIQAPPDNMVVSTGFAVIRPHVVDTRYAGYLFQSQFLIDEVIARSVGVSYPAINASELMRLKIPLPGALEQSVIGAFLDRETDKIDALVAEQQNLIALLKEKRQALISHAVTKGLDPDVPMKDSGVAWLGEVPAHWGVLPIRAVAKLESGHTPSRSRPDYWENCNIPWFTLADVWQIREGADYVCETKESVSELGLANSSARLLPAGTVILSRTASVGFSAIMGVPMATTQDFANWICGSRVLPRYLLHTLRAMREEFERLKFGSTHNTIYMPDIAAFRFALPSIEEQEVICAFVDRELSRIDTLIAQAGNTIALLEERRTALISAAVTGKIDVRSTVGNRLQDEPVGAEP